MEQIRGMSETKGYPRIKHERRLGDSRESAVLGCIYASDKSADCIFFIILVGTLVFSCRFLPSLFRFELLHRASCRCNISTLTDIKIHKQSEPRETGGLILFPDNDWSELFISTRKEGERKRDARLFPSRAEVTVRKWKLKVERDGEKSTGWFWSMYCAI